jgi:hypothetical protein
VCACVLCVIERESNKRTLKTLLEFFRFLYNNVSARKLLKAIKARKTIIKLKNSLSMPRLVILIIVYDAI